MEELEKGQAPGEAPAIRYRAFISYSHRDEAVATRLHRRLEAYRVPRRLLDRNTVHGPVPARLGRFFRDRDELHASPDLKASVLQALADSHWLLVVCSPHAARSAWVHREIIEFRRLHGQSGAQRILALIVSGEPFASHVAGCEAQECLPAALRLEHDADGRPLAAAIEPVAADLREQGDGPRYALLKLVAGMLGVAFDDLVRRDVQRRMRWMAGGALACLAGMALVGWLAIRADQARRDADHQRSDAEGLVEFMLVDLRKQLDAVGRLDVLDGVGEKVLARYQSPQALSQQDPASLAYRARAQHLIGNIRQQRGKLAEALGAYQSAAETTGRLLSMQPHDPQRIFDHAQSTFWVGYIAYDRRDMALAEPYLQQYLELAQQLIAMDPHKPEWQMELAYATQNLAVMWLYRLRFDEALVALKQAQAVWTLRMAKEPSRAADLALVLGWQSRAYRGLGGYDAAIEAQLYKERLYLGMPDAATDQQVQYGLANASIEIAGLELLRGRFEAAQQHAEGAVERSQALIAADSDNAIWRETHCSALLALAEAHSAQGQVASARGGVQRVDAAFNRLSKIDPSNVIWHVDILARILVLKNRLRVEDASTMDAMLMQYLSQAEAVDRSLLGLEQLVSVSSVESALARNLSTAGGAGQAQAQAHWRRVAERLQPLLGHPTHFHAVTLLAQAYLALGRGDEAAVLRSRLDVSLFRHPVYADLRHPLNAGAGHTSDSTKERLPHGRD